MIELAANSDDCLVQPEAGSDVKNLSTTAVKSADGTHYLVNGSKKWITNASK